ncbi:MAG: DUF1846 domain-containing protein [Erysipelotrichaceae bacterium]|nr:DUF1846 domain-containing protein [Erysipelotrichaceae bacterium]MBR5755024.1 DUF1846 domain-containing protein [Erysipelotrichaceae bacterium]
MSKVGFDNAKYIRLQSQNIARRVAKFNKLYLEFGGKLFDDNHASRVLPGFEPDSKIKMLLKIKDKVEIVLVINANDIEKNKMRSDLGITYSQDLLRLIDSFHAVDLQIGGVVITHFNKQSEAVKLKKSLEKSGIKVAYHYAIENYPNNVELILSDNGFGKNEYLETSREIIVVTAPGPGSGKMATCLSQMYHDNKHGLKSGYAKFETFPIWNLPLNHPVNLAYEAATVDLSDVNMIDPFHLEAYKKIAINYNRDVEVFPVLNDLLIRIMGKQIYKSPTDMGVNMVGKCICDDEVCQQAARNEIIRRYYDTAIEVRRDILGEDALFKMETIMNKAGVTKEDRKVSIAANELAAKTGEPAVAIEYEGKIITGKTSKLMGASAAALLNAIKVAGEVPDIHILSQKVLEPIQELKTKYLKGNNPRLHTDEVLIALAVDSVTSDYCAMALQALEKLKGCDVHSTVILSEVDVKTFKKLGMHLTQDPIYQTKKLYHAK